MQFQSAILREHNHLQLTEIRRYSLRKDDNRKPSGHGVLETIHAADDYRSLFIVSGTYLVGPGVAMSNI
jgi:hypothetical protein